MNTRKARRTTLVVNDKRQEITGKELDHEQGRAGYALLFLVCTVLAGLTVATFGDEILVQIRSLFTQLFG